jgi:hypothetical protein
VLSDPGSLRNQCGVDVVKPDEFFIHDDSHSAKDFKAADTPNRWIRIRKKVSDIWFPSGTKNGIRDGVAKDIRIRVAL